MNSSQRRQLTRGHPHVIKLMSEANSRYFEHDFKVEDARKWCRNNCKGSYKVDQDWDHAQFKFSKEKDAVIFALKWL